jgi:hypothetical protein
MFAKLARFQTFNRAAERRIGAAASNDNKPVRRVRTSPRRLRRPILLCRWHKVASGALECSWHKDAFATFGVEEPSSSRLLSRVTLAHRHRRGARFVTLEHIAASCSIG